MAVITVTWSIDDLVRIVADGIVDTVHYLVNATDGTYSTQIAASVSIVLPNEEFEAIPWEDLTEEICLNWVKHALGGEECVAKIESGLCEQIEEQRNPTRQPGKPF